MVATVRSALSAATLSHTRRYAGPVTRQRNLNRPVVETISWLTMFHAAARLTSSATEVPPAACFTSPLTVSSSSTRITLGSGRDSMIVGDR